MTYKDIVNSVTRHTGIALNATRFTVTRHILATNYRANSCGMIDEDTNQYVRVTLEAGDASVTLLVDADELTHPALRLGAVWTLTPPEEAIRR